MLLGSFILLATSLMVSADKHNTKQHEKPHCPILGPHKDPSWSLGVYNKDDHKIICTATLVAPRVALTSGICGKQVYEMKDSYYLVTGSDSESKKQKIVEVKFLEEHHMDEKKSWKHSVAVLIIEHSFGPEVDVLCLPKGKPHFPGQTCITTSVGGQGKSKGGQEVFKYAVQVSSEKCKLQWVKERDELLCVEGKEYQACQGIEGVTLACNDPSSHGYVMAGLMVGYGADKKCMEQDNIDVFTNIAFFIHSLEDKVPKNLLNSAPGIRGATLSFTAYALAMSLAYFVL